MMGQTITPSDTLVPVLMVGMAGTIDLGVGVGGEMDNEGDVEVILKPTGPVIAVSELVLLDKESVDLDE